MTPPNTSHTFASSPPPHSTLPSHPPFLPPSLRSHTQCAGNAHGIYVHGKVMQTPVTPDWWISHGAHSHTPSRAGRWQPGPGLPRPINGLRRVISTYVPMYTALPPSPPSSPSSSRPSRPKFHDFTVLEILWKKHNFVFQGVNNFPTGIERQYFMLFPSKCVCPIWVFLYVFGDINFYQSIIYWFRFVWAKKTKYFYSQNQVSNILLHIEICRIIFLLMII